MYVITGNEASDVSLKKQLCICIHWVDNNFSCDDEGVDDDCLSEWDEDCEIVTETEIIPLINLFSDNFVLNFT